MQHHADFEAFAGEQARPLLRTALALTRDYHGAQDLVQDTLARMFEIWGKVRDGRIDAPVAYAHTVLVHTYLARRRRRSFWELPTAQLTEQPAQDTEPALRLTVTEALSRLNARDRAVLELRFLCDRSVEQVAADLHVTAGTVRARTLRALRRLRASLGAEAMAELALR